MEQQPWKPSLMKQGGEIIITFWPEQTTDRKADGLYLLSKIDHLIYPYPYENHRRDLGFSLSAQQSLSSSPN